VVVGVSSERIQSALSLAEFACAHGADAINTANPTALSMGEVVSYFKRIDEVIDVPLFIQNLGPAFGGKSMTAEVMIRIIEQSKNQCYVKEEGADFLKVMAQMTAYQKSCPEKLLGVFGGQGCRFLFEEIRRGSVGTMPPSQLADVMVDIWNLAAEDKQQEAFDLFTKVLPLLLFFGNNKIPSYKEILKRRGVFTNTRCRPLNWPMMDDMAHKDLDFLMEQIEPSLRVRL
jgi:4-hydroxy-tetrahydrodipicolinate synthase